MNENEGKNQPSDEALMGSVADGSVQALETLVRRYEHRLFNYLARMAGNRTDADDLFQETFLRVYKHRQRYDRSARFRPWLYQIATNLCKDHHKYMRHRSHIPLDSNPGEGASLSERIADPVPGPSAQAELSEVRDALESAVAALPEHQRSVFLMSRYEGLRYEEIAESLGIPVGTVKSRMSKAVHSVMQQVEAVRR